MAPMTADELKQFRRSLNLTQARFALLLGATASAYQNWEQGHYPVPAWVEEKVREIAATRWRRG